MGRNLKRTEEFRMEFRARFEGSPLAPLWAGLMGAARDGTAPAPEALEEFGMEPGEFERLRAVLARRAGTVSA